MQKTDLLPILKEAKKYAISKARTRLPILATARIVSKNKKLTIETTDLEKHFVCIVDTDIPNMEITIDIRFLCALINVLDKGDISFEISDKKSALIIKQNRTEFNALINTNGLPDEFPPSLRKNDSPYTLENIVIGKNKVSAIIYNYIDEWQAEENAHKKAKKEANKLFPKYLKIDGVVAKKTIVSYEYIDTNNHRWYCDYDLCFGSGIADDLQKVFADEIKNYEAIDTTKRKRSK